MIKIPKKKFFFIILLAILAVIIDLPERYHVSTTIAKKKIDFNINPPVLEFNNFGLSFYRPISTRLGLDLSGGTHVVLDADMSAIAQGDRSDALEAVKQVIERRVNFFGVSEPIVQTAKTKDTYRVIVELPGVSNVDSAVAVIGQTAQLSFREFTDPGMATSSAYVIPVLENTKSVDITGKDLRRAQIQFSSQTGTPEVSIEFTEEGAKKFSEVTTRLIGKYLAIFLDNSPVTWPKVQSVISDGRAVITGNFTRDGAKTLALQLTAGALPAPVHIVEKRTVGATLGSASVLASLKAGAVGLAIVAAFMIAKYGWLGVFADMALVMYGLFTFALFRLIPVTLTLPGIAGFILSMGMAVDSNILIFERFREEMRRGRPVGIAMELGFGKAWDSIRDANITTIITSVILFNPMNSNLLPSSGLVRGFAATLFIGVLVSLFTGIVVTRTLIRVLYLPRKIKKL